MGSSPERGRRGKGERRQGARCWGAREAGASWGGVPGWLPTASLLLVCVLCLLCVRRNIHVRKKRRKERRKRKGRKRKKREKRQNVEYFFKLENFGEKNKRQFMKLVKNIFVQESSMSNYK
jgi:hypothetical protein